jgi:hypothetical protein
MITGTARRPPERSSISLRREGSAFTLTYSNSIPFSANAARAFVV